MHTNCSRRIGVDHAAAVRLEPVTTELWVRWRERAVMTAPVVHDLPMLGIAKSVGTPGVEGPVHSLTTAQTGRLSYAPEP